MYAYLSITGCRRTILDSVIDGYDSRTECSKDKAKYDNCLPGRLPEPSPEPFPEPITAEPQFIIYLPTPEP